MIDRRLVLAALVMIVLVTVGALMAIVFASPTNVVIERAGLITAFTAGPVGVLIAILQNNTTEQKVDKVQDTMNGHVDSHVLPGHSDEQIRDIVRHTIEEYK